LFRLLNCKFILPIPPIPNFLIFSTHDIRVQELMRARTRRGDDGRRICSTGTSIERSSSRSEGAEVGLFALPLVVLGLRVFVTRGSGSRLVSGSSLTAGAGAGKRECERAREGAATAGVGTAMGFVLFDAPPRARVAFLNGFVSCSPASSFSPMGSASASTSSSTAASLA
jgi:hypothetical protein